MSALLGTETPVICLHCGERTIVRGPTNFPTIPEGWVIDMANFYLPRAHHYCPRHARSARPFSWSSFGG